MQPLSVQNKASKHSLFKNSSSDEHIKTMVLPLQAIAINITSDGVFYMMLMGEGRGGGVKCVHLFKLVKTMEKVIIWDFLAWKI